MNPLHIDWHAAFVPTIGLLELFLRGSVMYLAILAAMRMFRRQKGSLNGADMLVILLVADAAQNGMSAQYNSITEGLVLVGTIYFWEYVLDSLAFRSPTFHKILNEPPLPLVKDGKLQRQNMRKEMLTREDVMEQLREQGVDDLSQVRHCALESDGHFSVIKVNDDGHRVRKRAQGT